MYCHGVQWLVGAARILAEQADARGPAGRGRAAIARRPIGSGSKISAIPHAVPGEIETYGGQPNQQAADMVTTFDPGRMIWNGYTGAGRLDVPPGARRRPGAPARSAARSSPRPTSRPPARSGAGAGRRATSRGAPSDGPGVLAPARPDPSSPNTREPT